MELTKVLSDSQIEQIQQASEEIIEHTGFKVMDDEVLRLCRKAGAHVDEVSGMVRMPRPLLRELVRQAPSSYTVTGLDGIERIIGGNNRQWGQAIVTDPWIVDYETQRPRRPRLDDIRTNTIIGQQLDHVMGMSRMDFPVTDVDGPHSSLRALEEHLLHHAKHHCVYVASRESITQWLEIGQILAQGEDLKRSRLFSIASATLTPLAISNLNVELMKIACEYNFPIVPTICPSAGTTSPFSLAGTLVIGHVEELFMVALSQIIKPGQPIIYTFGPAVTNMQSTTCMYYTLDKVLWKTAHVQLAKSCKLPSSVECGGAMTYRHDQQNGAEGMLFMLAAVASQADILVGFGSTYNAVGHCSEMMVIQDAWLRAAQFLRRGIRTDPERLAEEAIKQIHTTGSFITDKLTFEYMRGGEFFSNDLFDLSGERGGGPAMLERAHEKIQAMVADFKSPVPHKVREDLARYFHDQYNKTPGS